jgi:hypothetical protein
MTLRKNLIKEHVPYNLVYDSKIVHINKTITHPIILRKVREGRWSGDRRGGRPLVEVRVVSLIHHLTAAHHRGEA